MVGGIYRDDYYIISYCLCLKYFIVLKIIKQHCDAMHRSAMTLDSQRTR